MKLALFLSIVALHVMAQARVLTASLCPARDGKRYIREALRLEEEPWRHVLRTSEDHPGYPIAIHAAFRAAKAMGIESPQARVRIAEGISSLAGLLFALGSFAALRGLLGEAPAWIGAACIVTLPRPAEVFGDILSDPLHAFLWMASVLLLLRGAAAPRVARAALAGAVGAMAYWVRVDAATLPAALAGCTLILVARGATGWRGERFAIAYAVAFGVGLALFVAACGSLSPKPVTGRFFKGIIGLETGGAQETVRTAVLLGAWIVDPFVALYHVVKDLGQELQFVHLATAGCAALFVLARGGRKPVDAARGFLIAAVAVYAALGAVVDWRYGYVTGRYFLPVLPIVIAFGAKGAMEIAGAMRPSSRSAPGIAAALVLLASIACSAPSFLKGEQRGQYHGQLAAGRWIAEHASDGGTVNDPYFFPSYLAGLRDRGRTGYEPEPGRAHYVISDDRDLAENEELLRLLAGQRAKKVAAFPRRQGASSAEVAVYRIVGE